MVTNNDKNGVFTIRNGVLMQEFETGHSSPQWRIFISEMLQKIALYFVAAQWNSGNG